MQRYTEIRVNLRTKITRLITMRSKPIYFEVTLLLSLFLSCVADSFILVVVIAVMCKRYLSKIA